MVGGQNYNVNQAGVSCSYALSPLSSNVGSGSGGEFHNVPAAKCAWAASTTYAWIHTASTGSGNGTVSYTVDANANSSARSGTISAGGQNYTVNQAGVSCTYALSPLSSNVGSGSGSGSFTMTAPAGCAWAASTTYTWIHTTSTGGGNGTISYTVDANASSVARSGIISAGGQNYTVNQAGVSCSYALSPLSSNVGSGSGSGSFTMTAPAGCAWSASTTYAWIHTTSTGSGNGTVSYTVDANASSVARSGIISAGGQSYTVNQAGVSCSYALSPLSSNVGSGSGSGSFTMTAPAGCAWAASTTYAWIHTTSSGSGNGTVNYTVDANGTTSARSGTITAGGQSFTVSQAAVTCTYSLAASSASFNSAANGGSVGVTATAGCNWTITNPNSWITVTSGAGGTGNGTVNYTISGNSSASSRSGALTIAGQSFTVNQSGNLAPAASAGADLTVTLGNGASFSGAGSSDPDGSITLYQWDFGDGTAAAGLSVNHTYAGLGIYTVRLTVTDNLGASASDSALVTVVALADTTPPSVVLGVSGSPNVSGTVSLDATALDNVGVVKVILSRRNTVLHQHRRALRNFF